MNVKDKRKNKENQIIDAAEIVIGKFGLENTKMDDVAKFLGVSKGTIYFYLESKENLILAITYRAFQAVIDLYQRVVHEYRNKNGIESVLQILNTYMEFTETNYVYSEVLLNYLSIARSTGQGSNDAMLSESMKESFYFQKIKAIQHTPMEITIQEIKRGISDKSIRASIHPEMLYMIAYAMIIGFSKLNDKSITKRKTFMKINIEDWKKNIINEVRLMLST